MTDKLLSPPDMPKTLVVSSTPANMNAAMRVARIWAEVPDSVSDEEALRQGLISPDMLTLIMSILVDLFANCLSNRTASAWARVRGYVDNTKPLDKLGDTVRLQWLADRWMSRLGYPRDRGDVVALRQAIESSATSMGESEFRELQTEHLFLTI